MGVLDLTNLALKARKMQSRLKSQKSVGKSKSGGIALIIDGVYSIVEIEPDMAIYKSKFLDISEDHLKKILAEFSKDVKEAVEDAKSQLQKKMASETSLDDLRGMLG